jgi:uncharacterized membrane protein
MILAIIFGLSLLVLPFIVVTFKDRIPFSHFLSPVVICYGLGILGSILNGEQNNSYHAISGYMSQISILVAMPMLLYGSSSIRTLSRFKNLGLSFFLAVISAAAACLTVAMCFKNDWQSYAQTGAMLTGLYIGGTPNLQAIGFALKTDPNLTVQLTAADALIGGSYLILLTSVVPMLLSGILPGYKEIGQMNSDERVKPIKEEGFKREGRELIVLLLFTLGWLSFVLGILFLTHLITNTALVLFIVTGVSIGASFLRFISNKKETSFKFGEYLLLVFAISLSFQGKWSEIFKGGNTVLLITALSMYGSIFLHLVLSKIAGIDRETFLISSTAAVYGPPFVSQVATLLKNKTLLIPGILAGLCGYAIGNYLGLAVYYLLNIFRP